MNRDSISLNINNLNFDDNKSFNLNELSGQITSYDHVLKLNDLKVSTPYSTIEKANFMIDQSSVGEDDDFTASEIDIDLQNSTVDFRDVAQLVPALRGMDLQIDISGHVLGTLADLKGRDIVLNFGDYTNLSCDFYINGLPDLNNAFIDLELKSSNTQFTDIAKIKLPSSSDKAYLDFPDILYDAGLISYTGNFSGFLSDFVSFGTLESNFGYVNTDLVFSPGANNIINLDGHLKTVDFEIGRFTQINDLDKISFNGQVNGSYNNQNNLLTADIDGLVDSILYREYLYKNIILDGIFDDQRFEGTLSIDDQNLAGNFTGKVDFNEITPVFDFELFLNRANLNALNLDKVHQKSTLAIDLKANFTGKDIDDINGNIWIEEGNYSNENNSFQLNSLNLSTFEDSLRHLQIYSDFIDINISGNYTFNSIRAQSQKPALSLSSFVWNTTG